MRAHKRTVERTAADIITGLASDCGEELATPAADIAIHFLAGVDGLTERQLLLAASTPSTHDTGPAAAEAEAREFAAAETERALELLVGATLDLCRCPPDRADDGAQPHCRGSARATGTTSSAHAGRGIAAKCRAPARRHTATAAGTAYASGTAPWNPAVR